MARRFLSIVICTSAALLTTAFGLDVEAQVREVNGVVRGKAARSLMLRVPDQKGHLLGLVETQGVNESTGPGAFLNGASVRNVEQWDFVDGSGSDRGFIIFEAGANSLVARYEGRAAAKAGAATEISGQFTFVRGTGAWSAISGEGSYQGSASPQGFEFQWRATIR